MIQCQSCGSSTPASCRPWSASLASRPSPATSATGSTVVRSGSCCFLRLVAVRVRLVAGDGDGGGGCGCGCGGAGGFGGADPSSGPAEVGLSPRAAPALPTQPRDQMGVTSRPVRQLTFAGPECLPPVLAGLAFFGRIGRQVIGSRWVRRHCLAFGVNQLLSSDLAGTSWLDHAASVSSIVGAAIAVLAVFLGIWVSGTLYQTLALVNRRRRVHRPGRTVAWLVFLPSPLRGNLRSNVVEPGSPRAGEGAG